MGSISILVSMLIFGVIFATTASKGALLIQLNWVHEFLIY